MLFRNFYRCATCGREWIRTHITRALERSHRHAYPIARETRAWLADRWEIRVHLHSQT